MKRKAAGVLSLGDYEALARAHLPRPLFGYVAGACEDNLTVAANREAMRRVAFVPRALRDMAGRTQQVSLFGENWSSPFGIAPMGLSALIAMRGDIALAQAAHAENVPMLLSATSLIRLEEVRAVSPSCWFQAYLPADRDWIDGVVDRVTAAGFGTLVISVDVPVLGNRENLIRERFSTPLKPSLRLALDGVLHPRWLLGTFALTLLRHGMPAFENSSATRGAPVIARNVERSFGQRDRLTWDGIRHIRDRWRGNLVIKGLLHAEDASLARSVGADAIILSNHGGRQLDGAIATLDALPAAVAAAGDMPVLIDSGFRRGSDILKAIALGARMVLIGRPFLYAAAVHGEAGVRHAIGLLRAEIDRNMALLGTNSLDELGPDYLYRTDGAAI
ncbi:alpha-hydroxy-acid oxidizing protein [Sphingomonadales bacterium 56]|uniref:alpha-hydroxy acid oxidase n=1 Tax=unclassified Sphingobium TaxID=2611147 RepID=UPI001918405B|nr:MULTISPECIES: alpha-hydroxy acid oxidase [unclassified Sphingobium]MBY2930301.1 alpha-hydroxy-acid oxidizing protein [Sphingomonadales bacterium 56]MBY2960345.1 alpha-hydroxy-acid oxidizing protein [Sphingomonadales bacterium 58]